ncbi:MAG: histidine triad nucleotide-binding protein [Elusimicrobia bacterium]|nr:histidine triad nucleotide-binding protein [Elusimicrobiota bacterium]
MPDCIFCKIAEKEVNARIIYEDEGVAAFLDLNPQAPEHVLIIPKKHISCLCECGEKDVLLLGQIQLAAAKIAKERGLDSFRLVANCGKDAGQTVPHVHYHLLGGRRMNWPPG